MRRVRLVAVATTLAVVALSGCSEDEGPATPDPTPTASRSAEPDAEPEPDPQETPEPRTPEVELVEATVTAPVATGLAAPWGLAELPDGDWLVTQRDARTVLRVRPGAAPEQLTGAGAQDLLEETTGDGEGGLLGVALSPDVATDGRVYVYRTAEDGNEVLHGELSGTVLGPLTPVLSGIPAAANHNGGQLAFGPDGHLYVSTGDAGLPDAPQDPDSLAGKILRIAADGSVPADNPLPGSPLWSLGHRNVQGMGWSADGRMFASEFGQSTLDELNLIVAGGNYGWPDVEGTSRDAAPEDGQDGDGTRADDDGARDDDATPEVDGDPAAPGTRTGPSGYLDPVATWPTSEASPSGLAVTDEGVYLAGLRGERLWRVPLLAQGTGEPQALLAGAHGRLRSVVVAADGTLRLLTSNTDGRGTPREGDDQLLTVTITPSGS